MFDLGAPFHGEFSSADASALSEPNSRIILYPGSFTKSGTVITLTTVSQVIITDITIVSGAVITVQVYDGVDNTVDAGERIAQGNLIAGGVIHESAETFHYCKIGTWPKVKTSGAGQVDVIIRGRILNTAP